MAVPAHDERDWEFAKKFHMPIIEVVAVHLRKFQRQLTFRKGYITTLFALNDRDGFSPITLSGKYPVAELKVGLLMANSLF